MSETIIRRNEHGWPYFYFPIDNPISSPNRQEEFTQWVETVESKINTLVTKIENLSTVVNSNFRGRGCVSNENILQRLADFERKVEMNAAVENDKKVENSTEPEPVYCCPNCGIAHVLSAISHRMILTMDIRERDEYGCPTCHKWSDESHWTEIVSEKVRRIRELQKQIALLEDELDSLI